MEAQNADGVTESDLTHWYLDDISKCYFTFLCTLLLKDIPPWLLKEISIDSKVDLRDIVGGWYE